MWLPALAARPASLAASATRRRCCASSRRWQKAPTASSPLLVRIWASTCRRCCPFPRPTTNGISRMKPRGRAIARCWRLPAPSWCWMANGSPRRPTGKPTATAASRCSGRATCCWRYGTGRWRRAPPEPVQSSAMPWRSTCRSCGSTPETQDRRRVCCCGWTCPTRRRRWPKRWRRGCASSCCPPTPVRRAEARRCPPSEPRRGGGSTSPRAGPAGRCWAAPTLSSSQR